MRRRFSPVLLVTIVLLQGLMLAATSKAIPIVETFESYLDGATITTELSGLLVSAAGGGSAKIETASSPVIPGEPKGLYNDAPGAFPTGFEFALTFDFIGTGSTIGAIVDFGFVGTGLKLTAYSGPGGSGSVLGSTSTLTETFIGVTAPGIKSAVFEQAGGTTATWLIDNLTYETGGVAGVPDAGSAMTLLGLAMFGLGFVRRLV